MADVVLYTGDSLVLNIAVADSNGEDADISNAQASAYGIFNLAGEQLVSKRQGFGVEITVNIVTVTILPADTVDLPPGTYVQELEVIDAEALVHTVYQGTIELRRGYIYSEEVEE
ncbi:MAG: hypothetical protein DMF06_03395 [Verrucomicrobia bacterium]|nr:MAG: hypothetical protein DMF06_03395 [Verrucomicrobiota bacterium]